MIVLKDKLLIHFSSFFQYYLFFIILITLSPVGHLSGNEEMYYGLAKKFLDPEWNGEYSAFILSGDYRFLSDTIIGAMLKIFGFESTQIIGSVIASILLTHAVKKLVETVKIDDAYGLLATITFILLGQSFIGREWLFEDFEAKVFAYYFVILSISYHLREKHRTTVILLAVATYFHLLVGGVWMGLVALSELAQNRSIRVFFKNLILYTILASPVLILSIYGFVGTNYIQDSSLPTPSYIYSIIRQYKMVAPFYSLPSFVISWLPGIAVYFGILLGFLLLTAESEKSLTQRLRALVKSSTFVIFILLVFSFFDTNGVVGKFYPYRFTSLLLLLTLFYYGFYLKKVDNKSQANLGLTLLCAVFPVFTIVSATSSLIEMKDQYQAEPAKTELYNYIARTTSPNDLILVDPILEENLFDLERKSNRPTLTSFKYIPSSKDGLIEWFKRREFKSSVFFAAESIDSSYKYNYLISGNQKTIDRLALNHEIVFRNSGYTLLMAN